MSRKQYASFEGMEPGSVWTPPVPEGQYAVRMPYAEDHDSLGRRRSPFEPNKDHFWWQEYAE